MTSAAKVMQGGSTSFSLGGLGKTGNLNIFCSDAKFRQNIFHRAGEGEGYYNKNISKRGKIICMGSETDVQKMIKAEFASGRFEIDPAYYNGSEYLRSLGIQNQAEISRILDIAMNPNTLFVTFGDKKRSSNVHARILSVEEDIKPIVKFFGNKGLNNQEIIKVISSHPPVLCYNMNEYLEPWFSFLQELGIEDITKTILERPSILGLDVDNNLKKIVGYLQANDYSREKIIDIIQHSI